MEYQADIDQITALKVRPHLCCIAYEETLKKILLKHEGVFSVEMNREKSFVLVRGKVDPNSLITIVARTGRQAEIVSSNSNTRCCSSCQESYRSHSACDCCQQQQQQGQHRCEDYVPPSVDEYYPYMRPRRPMYHQPESASFFDHHGGLGTPFGNPPRRFPPPHPGYGGYPRRGYYGYGH